MLFHIKICKYLAISDNILNNDALKHNGSELKHETWTQLLQKLQIYEKGMDHIQHLRTRWVLGAADLILPEHCLLRLTIQPRTIEIAHVSFSLEMVP